MGTAATEVAVDKTEGTPGRADDAVADEGTESAAAAADQVGVAAAYVAAAAAAAACEDVCASLAVAAFAPVASADPLAQGKPAQTQAARLGRSNLRND